MKKVCLLLLYMFNVSLLFSQSLEDEQLKLKLLDFFNGIISKDTTVDSLINNYGNPDLVVNKKSGYLDDEMITYSYENMGNFNFFYKTDEKKIYFWSVNLNSNFIDIINFPTTMDGVDNYFNTKFTRRISQLNPGNIYLGYYGEFSINFIFKESDNKLYQINWILH